MEISPAGQVIEDAIAEALAQARSVSLSSALNSCSDIALVENNASVAGGIANCLAQLRAGLAPAEVKPPPHASSFSILQPTPSPALASAISSSAERTRTDKSHDSDSTRDGSSCDEDSSSSSSQTKKPHGRPVVLGATVVDLTVRVDDHDFKVTLNTVYL
ncbi:hypothetical protein ElyMa_001707000 [Elysia marginata]|uniref:Uncharacterized protein n=1 Tax=Elysia marginata TaxID=1093978 RepID=A0AAV4JUM4_9GAST|nr:hypothetical protein ElyMa_001707000 [Elysia marginata]